MKRDWWPDEFQKLVTLGESTTAGGWSTSPERCWPPRLKALIDDFQSRPVELFNAGIGANVISPRSPGYPHSGKPAASERLGRHVIDQRPDLLVVSYGLNDARGATPVEQFAEDMTALVGRVRERIQPLIVLLGPYFMTDFELGGEPWAHGSLALFHQFNDAIAAVARAEGCLFVDLLAASGESPWLVHDDGVHQNDLGHRLVANRVFEVLAQNCSGLARRTKQAELTSPRWRDESTLRADFGY